MIKKYRSSYPMEIQDGKMTTTGIFDDIYRRQNHISTTSSHDCIYRRQNHGIIMTTTDVSIDDKHLSTTESIHYSVEDKSVEDKRIYIVEYIDYEDSIDDKNNLYTGVYRSAIIDFKSENVSTTELYDDKQLFSCFYRR